MLVPNLEIWKVINPRLLDNLITITEVWQTYDGLVNGRCNYLDENLYFIWVQDDDTDYFVKRTYAVVRPPQNSDSKAIEDGETLGWFIEGEADYEAWNKLRTAI